MSDVKVKRSKVRDPLEFDTHLYDDGIDCSVEPSMTKQEFRDECDINQIMARYEKTGQLPSVNYRQPMYGDVSSLASFHDAMNTVVQAEQMFMALPAELRDRFGNDPAQMLKFLDDPENKDEAIRLGIVNAPPEPEPPAKVEIVNPAPAPKPDLAKPADAG